MSAVCVFLVFGIELLALVGVSLVLVGVFLDLGSEVGFFLSDAVVDLMVSSDLVEFSVMAESLPFTEAFFRVLCLSLETGVVRRDSVVWVRACVPDLDSCLTCSKGTCPAKGACALLFLTGLEIEDKVGRGLSSGKGIECRETERGVDSAIGDALLSV